MTATPTSRRWPTLDLALRLRSRNLRACSAMTAAGYSRWRAGRGRDVEQCYKQLPASKGVLTATVANKEQWRHWQAQKNRKLLVVPGRELLVVSHNHKHARHQRQQHRHIRWPWLPRRQQPARQEHQQRQSCQSGVCCAARTAGSGPVSLAAWLPLLLLATATGLRALLFERCAALRSGPDALLAAWAVMPRRGRRGTKQRCMAAA